MARIPLLQSALLILVLCPCVRALNHLEVPEETIYIDPFAVRMISDDHDWSLRMNGDGSATLSHRQYPGYHLDFPVETFDFGATDHVLLSEALNAMPLAVEDDRSAISCRLLQRQLAWQPND